MLGKHISCFRFWCGASCAYSFLTKPQEPSSRALDKKDSDHGMKGSSGRKWIGTRGIRGTEVYLKAKVTGRRSFQRSMKSSESFEFTWKGAWGCSLCISERYSYLKRALYQPIFPEQDRSQTATLEGRWQLCLRPWSMGAEKETIINRAWRIREAMEKKKKLEKSECKIGLKQIQGIQ